MQAEGGVFLACGTQADGGPLHEGAPLLQWPLFHPPLGCPIDPGRASERGLSLKGPLAIVFKPSCLSSYFPSLLVLPYQSLPNQSMYLDVLKMGKAVLE